ncbi:MAG: DUF1109 domain-containing protein [Proteobacteria bacterium]|nr:DUF1109 domain-containing protein [Pseudomonadota bacterium]
MNVDTNAVIQRLVDDCLPVRRLPPTWALALAWIAIALASVAIVVYFASPRGDLADKAGELRFLIEQGAALATSVTAAIAAFMMVVPGHSRAVAALPVPPLAVWLASLGQGCTSNWLVHGAEGFSIEPDWICFPAIVVVGAVPALAMVLMLRRGAPLTPHLTMALGGLAAAAIGNFGLRLFHPQDASLMVLVWQFGTVAALSVLAGSIGRQVFSWQQIMPARVRASGVG